jgi:hypothetical protein
MGGSSKSIGAPNPVGMKAPMLNKPPKPAPFMADGGMGGDPGEPDADDMGGGAAVKPEAVNYHPDEHECQMCQYMDDGGNCSVLKMQVSPVGGCNAFEAKESEGEGMEEPNEEGMSGGPPMGGGREMYGRQ